MHLPHCGQGSRHDNPRRGHHIDQAPSAGQWKAIWVTMARHTDKFWQQIALPFATNTISKMVSNPRKAVSHVQWGLTRVPHSQARPQRPTL
jgi:hypothetical protein